jgi:hypothetical protein
MLDHLRIRHQRQAAIASANASLNAQSCAVAAGLDVARLLRKPAARVPKTTRFAPEGTGYVIEKYVARFSMVAS